MARAKKEKPEPGPDDLVRESAGAYLTGDGRFHVEKSDMGWYLVDTQQTNEFGQQLIHGPLGTLDAIREAIPGARDLKPLLRVRPEKPGTGTAATAGKAKATAADKAMATGTGTAAGKAIPAAEAPAKREPPPPPQTWIDRLPSKEQAQVRQLIRSLEKEGLTNAEELVRRHRDDATPLIAARVIEHRLQTFVDEQPESARESARVTIRRVIEILTTDGLANQRPAPRWALVELPSDEPTPKARIRPEI